VPHHGRADEARAAGDEDRGTLEAHCVSPEINQCA
jgi:hypothetical protein